jgi:hypothetical protein
MDAPMGQRPTVSPFAAGLAAVRKFWRPFVLIQGVALTMGLAYRSSESVRAACVALAAFRTRGGLAFSAIAGLIAGAVLPEVAKWLADHARARPGPRLDDMIFNGIFFAGDGALIDGLYRMEARLFGDDARTTTVIAKTAFDQFVFSPLWVTVIVTLFLWRRQRYSWAATRPARHDRFLRTRVLPLLVSNWCFWIPIVLIVYALPSPLQFVMFAFALAAWSLIMVFIAGESG